MFLHGIANLDEKRSNTVLEDMSRGFMARVYDTFCEKTEGEYHFKTIDEVVLPKNLHKCTTYIFNYNSNSMEPTLPRLSLVGVVGKNCEEKLPVVSGELYALYLPQDGIVFRRIYQNIEDNSYVICFENPKMPSNTISHKNLQDKLLGRVSWVLHKF